MAAKRRTISYRDTARLAVVGGTVALVTTATRLALPVLVDAPPPGADGALGTAGLIAWFLGVAAGVLALSTPHKRTAIVGLVLCGLAAVGFAIVLVGTGVYDAPLEP